MGGSKSQPKKTNLAPQAQSSMEPMLAYMAMQQQQQSQQASADAAAAEAQRQTQIQAQIQAQTQAGQQAQMQGEQAAKQALGGMNTAQQAQDAAIVSQQVGGSSATGGIDVGQARQQSLQQMGVQPTMTTPLGMANQGVGGTQQNLNKFATPATTGLTFGGS